MLLAFDTSSAAVTVALASPGGEDAVIMRWREEV